MVMERTENLNRIGAPTRLMFSCGKSVCQPNPPHPPAPAATLEESEAIIVPQRPATVPQVDTSTVAPAGIGSSALCVTKQMRPDSDATKSHRCGVECKVIALARGTEIELPRTG